MNINIPSSLNEICLGQYQHYLSIVDKESDADGNIKDGRVDYVNQKCVEIFCRLEEGEYLELPISVASNISKKIGSLFNSEGSLYKRVTLLDGKKKIKLGFIPDLENISVGEYIDIEDNLWQTDSIHKAMAVLYRPITLSLGDKYEIAKYTASQQYVDTMKAMPVSAALGAQLFFYRLGSELSIDITLSLISQEMLTLLDKVSVKNGDGTAIYTHWQEKTL